MLSVRLRRDEDRDGSVFLCVQNLHAACSVTCIARSVKDRARIVFLRFVIENENDLALRIDTFVVVVMEFGRGYAVTREDNRGAHRQVVRKSARYVGVAKCRLSAAAV